MQEIRLMIVDDSKIMRNTISNIAKNIPGLKIEGEANNGAVAVQIFKSLNPHVVTMDLTMPKMNGVETIGRLLEINPDVKILVVSSLNDLTTALQAIDAGALGFLHKPFSPEELCSKLKEILLD